MDVCGEDGLPPGDDIEPHADGGEQRASSLNINDVIEAISAADPDAAAELAHAMSRSPAAPRGGPYVRIVEQPASKALRFRYICEGRSAGSIPGVNSTADRKTYPTIEICGHTGKAVVVVSCVTRDEPYKPHPHNLVGRERCRSGVCTVKTDLTDNSLVSFSNLGIQCVKRRDIADALRVRENLRVDPFKTGYGHMNQPQSIDLNAVRLCFQVFLVDEAGKIRHSLQPVVSEVIYDKKAMSDLSILRISRPSGSAKGGTEVMLLCEKVTREDISVVLYEEGRDPSQPEVIWEESANIIVVHKQVAIAFTTPPYRQPLEQEHREVYVQLKRISDNARSNSIQFTYVPDTQDYLKRKRQKTLSVLQQYEQEKVGWPQEQKPIKAEPSERSPRPVGGSPLRYTPLEQVADPAYQQQWMSEAGMGGMPLAGGSAMPTTYYPQQELWGPAYAQPAVTPLQVPLQSRSPSMLANMPVTSPSMHAMSPMQQAMSPMQQAMSPMQQAMSPMQQAMSPMHAVSPSMVMSPMRQAMSPLQQQAMSPLQQAVSPHAHAVSPLLHAADERPHLAQHGMLHAQQQQQQQQQQQHQQHQQHQQQQQQQPMESSNSIPSLSNLLMDGTVAPLQLNSGDLSNLSALLSQSYRPHELSDSLARLSTGDLLHPAEL